MFMIMYTDYNCMGKQVLHSNVFNFENQQ